MRFGRRYPSAQTEKTAPSKGEVSVLICHLLLGGSRSGGHNIRIGRSETGEGSVGRGGSFLDMRLVEGDRFVDEIEDETEVVVGGRGGGGVVDVGDGFEVHDDELVWF